MKYLASLSQHKSKAPDARSSRQEQKNNRQHPSDRVDGASSANSRTPTIRPGKTTNGADELATTNGHQFSSAGLYKTPSPTRSAYRPQGPAYPTLDAYDAVSPGPKSAPLHPNSQHWPHASDDLESQASTAAQSGLWDELHDLKTRMRKLESSSTRSRHYSTTTPTTTDPTSSFDRPKTGTTHTTTSASRRSSNNNGHLSPTFHSRGQPPQTDSSEIHPLLRSALRKTRLAVSREVYAALESSASDALQLASSARTGVDTSDLQSYAATAVDDGPEIIAKRVQRRADNLCRSLTELCIVLCEQARASSSSGMPPRSPYDSTRPPPSALSGINLSAHRPGSSGRAYAASEFGPPPSSTLVNSSTDSPSARFDSRRLLADRISRLHDRHNARSLDSRVPNGRANSVVETSTSTTWTSKPLNRATTANVTRPTHGSMPTDPADLVDDEEVSSANSNRVRSNSASAASASNTNSDEEMDGRSTVRASRAQTEPPPPVANMARRTIADGKNHSPRDLRISRDYTQRHPLPDSLSPSIRKVLENRNGSSPSVASAGSRTTRAGSVGAQTPRAARENGVPGGGKRSSLRTSVPMDDGDEASPTTVVSARAGSKDVEAKKDKDADTRSERSRVSVSARSQRERLPPSSSAGLAERLEAKRRERTASNGNSDGKNFYKRA